MRMQKHLSIITGASRGLGFAMAQQCLAQGHRVLAISRKDTVIDSGAGELISWSADLSAPQTVAERLAHWLQTQDAAQLAEVSLINNAGVVSQLAPLSNVQAADIAQALRVGLEAPMLLTAAFLRTTATWRAARKVLLISSGLGRHAMAGSASYCAAKAGLDHMARAVALEEARSSHGARIVSLAPGIVDTDMQVQLRGADPALFPNRERFVAFKEGGQLDSPAAAAAKVLKYLAREDFGNNPVADVRDA
jgi:benzil reductase ((S)-benzoin forming)